jgi:CubicO group peptidase (beta-lactamase class C family)
MHSSMNRVLGLVVAGLFLLPLSAGADPKSVEVSGQWPVSTPSAENVDGDALQALDQAIRAGEHGYVDSLLVIRNGAIVFEQRYPQDYAKANAPFEAPSHMYNYLDETWHPWLSSAPELHTMQSVSKSVLSVLYGIAAQQGKLPPIDTPAYALLSGRDFEDPDGRKSAITLKDLLNMRGGTDWNEDTYDYTDARNHCAIMEGSEDWVQMVLDQPMAADPGTTYVYNSGSTMVLAEILENLVGQKVADYAEAELFGPLGIKRYYWKHTPTGLADAEGGLYLAPRDIAKITKLMMNNGQWGSRQLVSSEWVTASMFPETASVYPDDETWSKVGYGYQWWNFSGTQDDGMEMYGGVGYGGQYPMAVPELDLVIVVTGWNNYGEATGALTLILEHILPAVRGKEH